MAGLDKDTVATALEDLAALELVRVELQPIVEGDLRKVALVRLAERAYAARGERHVVFPGRFVYGGGWGRLPGAAGRHLCLAWAAWARTRIVDPAAGPLPRTLRAIREALAPASGMGATAVRKSVAALAGWATPDGVHLVQERGGFLRPDLRGAAANYEWPLSAAVAAMPEQGEEGEATRELSGRGDGAAAAGADDVQLPQGWSLTEREAKVLGGEGPLSAGDAGGDRAVKGEAVEVERGAGRKRRSPRNAAPVREPVHEPAPELPPLEGPEVFEARKAWFIRSYLGPWANRVLRRSWEPAKQAVLLDLCPGSCEDGLPPALQAAAEIALRMRRYARKQYTPLKIIVVEPDPARARRLRSARPAFAHVLSVTEASATLSLARLAERETPTAALIFAGAVDDEALFRNELGAALSTRDRELVVLSRAGLAEPREGRLWRLASGIRTEEERDVVRFARAALAGGARTVLSTPLVSQEGAPAGLIVHAASGYGALAAWKSGVFAARRPALSSLQPGFAGRSLVQIADLASALARAFPGRQLRWTNSENDRTPTVRGYAVNRSSLLPSELGQFRRELVERGWRASLRPLVFTLPKK
ncbi:MAG TPA: hypothetical protein VGX50_19510 [Longimicrobium sp.]|nr:hypothetical protein [Longimicrobium sp.]